jgi:hypothetical protein
MRPTLGAFCSSGRKPRSRPRVNSSPGLGSKSTASTLRPRRARRRATVPAMVVWPTAEHERGHTRRQQGPPLPWHALPSTTGQFGLTYRPCNKDSVARGPGRLLGRAWQLARDGVRRARGRGMLANSGAATMTSSLGRRPRVCEDRARVEAVRRPRILEELGITPHAVADRTLEALRREGPRRSRSTADPEPDGQQAAPLGAAVDSAQ